MEKQNVTHVTASTFPVVSLLGVVLVVLKLLGKITLAWKWVLAPFWVPLVVAVGMFGAVAILAGLVALIAHIVD